MKIVDCFMFYNELKILEFRMQYLYNYVDHFVIMEANLTHAGNPKPFYFEENKHLFQKYLDKVVHVKVYDDDVVKEFSLSFTKHIFEHRRKFREAANRGNFQRNCLDRGIKTLNLGDNDVIISSDVDEIVDKNIIQKIRNEGLSKIHGLNQVLYYYNLTCRSKNVWDLARCIPYWQYKLFNKNLAFIRSTADKPPNFEKGGWHFSYFGDLDFILNKIKQSSDQSVNTPEIADVEKMKSQIAQNKDLFRRSGEDFETIKIEENDYLPDGYEFLN